jgi:hypothetical protein
MTPTEVQTLVTAFAAMVVAISALITYLTKRDVAVVKAQTNGNTAELAAKVVALHAALHAGELAAPSPATPPQ